MTDRQIRDDPETDAPLVPELPPDRPTRRPPSRPRDLLARFDALLDPATGRSRREGR